MYCDFDCGWEVERGRSVGLGWGDCPGGLVGVGVGVGCLVLSDGTGELLTGGFALDAAASIGL